jgi:hypothetical protein
VECWTNAGVQNDTPQIIRAPRGDEIPLGRFENSAFLEFSISTSTGVRARYGEVKVGFGDVCDLYYLAPFAMRADSQYRRVQAPLRVFTHAWACPGETPSELPLTWEEMREGLTAVSIGAPWDPGSVVRLDDVQIRW